MSEEGGQKRWLLQQQIAIVTGSAKGIGRGIATEMAQEGASVVIADIDDAGMDETEKLITGAGGICLKIHTDVQNAEQRQQLVAATLQQFGTIDILVNNAGINTPGGKSFLDILPETYDSVLQTNTKASFFLAQQVAREMIQRKKEGSILFTSSTHARIISMQPAYSASKAAIEMLVREMALELADYGIRVNAVAPGWIRVRERAPIDNPFVPLGRSGNPEDIARAMVFLASPYASYITGQTVTVDGGFSLTHTSYWFKKDAFVKRK